ncbi:MAG TPA: methyltransferase domain-containing protein [Myxococcaceae bacterium]|jgi:ubiquinone/menaquinone biosynthesis C-methylase UbiE
MSQPPTERHYILGHEERELQRLILQAEFYRPLMEDLLNRAGLAPGMRVLDVGCGVGDVSFMLAERVGPTGQVVGIDSSVEAITRARRRPEARRWAHVRFEETRMDAFKASAPFDAVVGRMVLMYQPDPLAMVRQAAALVRPGGRVVFQELEVAAMGYSWPKLPLFTKVWEEWMVPTCERAGLVMHMGLELVPTLQRAGLLEAEGLMGGRVAPGSVLTASAFVAETVRTLVPLITRLGVATAEEVGIDTLAERVSAELVEHGGVMVPSLLVGAWARKPG